jgi:predicted regulator of amino acid metabolism with ACT domain
MGLPLKKETVTAPAEKESTVISIKTLEQRIKALEAAVSKLAKSGITITRTYADDDELVWHLKLGAVPLVRTTLIGQTLEDVVRQAEVAVASLRDG